MFQVKNKSKEFWIKKIKIKARRKSGYLIIERKVTENSKRKIRLQFDLLVNSFFQLQI